MKQLFTTLLATGALALGTQVAEATQINGTIQISGSVDLYNSSGVTTTSLASADQAKFTTTGLVTAAEPGSSYAGTFGSSVTWADFSWNPSSTPVSDLWTFDYNGFRYSFDLDNITLVTHVGAEDLMVDGNGTVRIESLTNPLLNFTPTPANWNFRITDTAGGNGQSFTFGFTDSNTAAAPDGGATAMLLGAGFLGLAGLRRKLS